MKPVSGYNTPALLRFTWITVVVLMLLCSANAIAQTGIKGILRNSVDSTPIPYAIIELVDTKEMTLTDSVGAFYFSTTDRFDNVTFTIATINFKSTIKFQLTHALVEQVYIKVEASTLNEFVLRGMTAKEVVEKAVASIPVNFDTASHFEFGFYREYEKVNNTYTNFTEAQLVPMFKFKKTGKLLTPSQSFAVQQLRRSRHEKIIDDFRESDMNEVFVEDPVYHLKNSSLNPEKFSKYIFRFDTVQKSGDYVVNYYRPDFTSEMHGIGYYTYSVFYGEAVEHGTITIERKTFAIKKVTRSAVINPKYDYGPESSSINIVFPSKRFFFRFVDGALTADYAKMNGKWHLQKMCHTYTNNYFETVMGNLVYKITDNSEWYCDSVSRYIGKDLLNQFYPGAYLYGRRYNYNADTWKTVNYPYYFDAPETIFRGLERHGKLEKQFIAEGVKE